MYTIWLHLALPRLHGIISIMCDIILTSWNFPFCCSHEIREEAEITVKFLTRNSSLFGTSPSPLFRIAFEQRGLLSPPMCGRAYLQQHEKCLLAYIALYLGVNAQTAAELCYGANWFTVLFNPFKNYRLQITWTVCDLVWCRVCWNIITLFFSTVNVANPTSHIVVSQLWDCTFQLHLFQSSWLHASSFLRFGVISVVKMLRGFLEIYIETG